MRHIQYCCVFLFSLLASSNVYALDAAASGECIGGTHFVSVSGYYIAEDDGEISGLVFKCEAIGVCEPSFFYPETPLPFVAPPNPDTYPRYHAEFSIDPPIEGVAYRYTPYGVRPDGSLVSTWHHCDGDSRSYALVSCSEVPIARGRLVYSFDCYGDFCVRLESCEANCWTEQIWTVWDYVTVLELSDGSGEVLYDQIVDVFGERTYCTMPGGDKYTISRFSLSADSDCGAVSIDNLNWGSLKAQFR